MKFNVHFYIYFFLFLFFWLKLLLSLSLSSKLSSEFNWFLLFFKLICSDVLLFFVSIIFWILNGEIFILTFLLYVNIRPSLLGNSFNFFIKSLKLSLLLLSSLYSGNLSLVSPLPPLKNGWLYILSKSILSFSVVIVCFNKSIASSEKFNFLSKYIASL